MIVVRMVVPPTVGQAGLAPVPPALSGTCVTGARQDDDGIATALADAIRPYSRTLAVMP